GIRHTKNALDTLPAASQNAAHLVWIALPRVRQQLRLQRGRKHYHQTLVRTVSCASSSDFVHTPSDRYFQPASANRHTMSPRSSPCATRTAACSTAPEEIP